MEELNIGEKMELVIYENHPNNKTMIHSITCNCYVNRKNNSDEYGNWHTGFLSLLEAQKFVDTLHKKNNFFCKKCNPESLC